MTARAIERSAVGAREVAIVEQVARAMARKLRHVSDPSDLASLGLLVLWDAAGQHDPTRTAFAPYLVERLRWAMLSDARRVARRERLLEGAVAHESHRLPADGNDGREPEAAALPIERAVDPEHQLEDRERRAELHAALGSLPNATRSILVRHYFGGESLESMASESGRSKATLTRMHQAGVRQLATLLGHRAP